MAERTKHIFISDVHLGGEEELSEGRKSYNWLCKEEADELGKFLAYLNNNSADIKKIILLGDLFDNWVWPIDKIPPSFSNIVAAPNNQLAINNLKILCENASDDTYQVIYMPGNHDMAISKEFIEHTFNGITFLDFLTNDVKSVFKTSTIWAEHGYGMFNCPDPAIAKKDVFNNIFRRDVNPDLRVDILPLGYYLSRITATQKTKNLSSKNQWWKLGNEVFDAVYEKEMAAVVDAVLEYCGMDKNTTEIFMDDNHRITVSQVKELFNDLYVRWKENKNYSFEEMLDYAVYPDITKHYDYAKRIRKNGNKIVILGHTHNVKLENPGIGHEWITANIGTWCRWNEAGKKYTFVEIEDDNGNKRQYVRLKNWEKGKIRKLKEIDYYQNDQYRKPVYKANEAYIKL